MAEGEMTTKHGPRVVVMQLDKEQDHVEVYGPFADEDAESEFFEENKQFLEGWTFHFVRMGDPSLVTKATHSVREVKV
jgi:hypothetical protein